MLILRFKNLLPYLQLPNRKLIRPSKTSLNKSVTLTGWFLGHNALKISFGRSNDDKLTNYKKKIPEK